MTFPERKLWFFLRDKLPQHKFRRQHGIGSFIVDFYCPEKKLIIEIDGETHGTLSQQLYDEERSHYFNKLGITVIRFSNSEIMMNVDNVLESVYSILK